MALCPSLLTRPWSPQGLAPALHFCGAPSLPLPALTGVEGSQSCQSQLKEGSSQQDKKATGHQEVAQPSWPGLISSSHTHQLNFLGQGL